MNKVANKLKAMWKDESAQGALEYILLIAIVVTVVIMFRDKIKTAVKGKLEEVGTGIDGVKVDP